MQQQADLMASDNFDLVSGAAWHDGLAYPPQQGEEAGGIQQNKPAQNADTNQDERHPICSSASSTHYGLTELFSKMLWPVAQKHTHCVMLCAMILSGQMLSVPMTILLQCTCAVLSALEK